MQQSFFATICLRLVALCLAVVLPSKAFAQVATTLQVIHNAADPAAANVGVWIGTPPIAAGLAPVFTSAVPNFAFRTTTPLLSGLGTAVPSFANAVGVPLTVNITRANAAFATPALSSTSPVALARGANIVIANGVLNPNDFAPNPENRPTAFRLFPIVDTTSVIASTQTRLVVFHGSTDAPRVDVIARGVGVLGTVSYGESFQVSVPTSDYTIDIRPAGTNSIIASYSAPLRGLQLGGQRVVVTASGFLTPTANRNGAALRLVASVSGSAATALVLATAPPPPASLQVIHNAADPAVANVGVWAGLPAPNTTATTPAAFLPAVPNLAFRTSTPALLGLGTAVPAFGAAVGVPLTVNITTPNAASANPPLATFSPVRLQTGTNIVIANGVGTPANFAPNPDRRDVSFNLFSIVDTLVNIAANQTRLVVFHGATDAPRVSVVARGVGTLGTFSYGENFQVTVPVSNYTIDIVPVGTTAPVASFSAPLATLALGGQRVVVSASGFLNPAANRNGAPFGLLASVGGTTALSLMLPTAAPPAPPAPPPVVQPTTLQIIHNAADPAAASVGVWAGLPSAQAGTPPTFVNAVSALNFRFGTSALTGLGSALPSFGGAVGVPLTVNITGANARSATPAVASFSPVTLARGTNIVLANGVLMPQNYAPNPDRRDIAFRLFPILDTTSMIPEGRTRLVVFHGATDAPRVDVVARGVGTLGTFSYGENFQVTVDANDYVIDIRPAGSTTVVASFVAPLRSAGLAGQRVVVAASGFLNPAANRGGAPFGLLAVVNSATVSTALMLPAAPSPANEPATSLHVIHNAADPFAANVGVWIGLPSAQAGLPSLFLPAVPTFAFRTATPTLTALPPLVPSLRGAVGVPLTVNITAPNAAAANPALATFSPVALRVGANIVLANGLGTPANFAPNPDRRDVSFRLFQIVDTTLSIAANQTRLVVFHGCTDAPRVSVVARGVGTLGTVSYGESFQATVPTNNYTIDIVPVGATAPVASFSAPLATLALGGQRVVVAASGFLNPTANRSGQAFGLLAAVQNAAGTALMLPSAARALAAERAANDELAETLNAADVRGVQMTPNPLMGEGVLHFSLNADDGAEANVSVINALGQTVWASNHIAGRAGAQHLPVNVSALPRGVYSVQIRTAKRLMNTRVVVQ